MTQELKLCPFCGGGETRIDNNNHWTGKRNALVSATLRHWCVAGGSVLQFTRRTEELCVAAWNTRAEMEKSDD